MSACATKHSLRPGPHWPSIREAAWPCRSVAWVQLQHVLFGTAPDLAAAWHAGFTAATQAIEIDRNDSQAYALKAFLLSHASDRQRATEDLANARRAYELNPNNMWAMAAVPFS